MKSLIQTYLIGGGVVGFVLSLPFACYDWMMHRGFGGELTGQERLLLFSPLIFVIATAIGVVWKRSEQKPDDGSEDIKPESKQ
jgi:hypothetical protein